jgi:hypothetical protein
VSAVWIHSRWSFCSDVLGTGTGHLVFRELPRVRGEAVVCARHGGGVREAELTVAQQWRTGAGRGATPAVLLKKRKREGEGSCGVAGDIHLTPGAAGRTAARPR